MVDDRTLWGSGPRVDMAIRLIMVFDERAGHVTHPGKLAFSATTGKLREWCRMRHQGLEGLAPKVLHEHTLVGDALTTGMKRTSELMNKRAAHALAGWQRINDLDCSNAAKWRGAMGLVIPRLAVSQLTVPATHHMNTLRQRMVSTLVGKHRRMRCQEVVLGVAANPIWADPWGALAYNGVMRARRLLVKSQERLTAFLKEAVVIHHNRKGLASLAVWPVSSLLIFLGQMDTNVDID